MGSTIRWSQVKFKLQSLGYAGLQMLRMRFNKAKRYRKETDEVPSQINDLIADMHSNNIEITIRAFDDAARICKIIAENGAEAFSKGGYVCYFRGERIGRFGSLVINDLEDLVTRSRDAEVRILAAINLLNLGSSAGVDVLLKEIESGDQYVCLVAGNLGRNGVAEAAVPMMQRLRIVNPKSTGTDYKYNQDKEIAISLILALTELGVEIPEDIRECFSAPHLAIELRKIVNNPKIYR
jgi:hypothetical protein